MFGQPSLLDGVDPGRDLRTESLGREHFAFERKNLSAVSLLCGRIFPQHRTQSCNPGLHLVDPDLQPTVLVPKRNVFRIRLQGRNTGPAGSEAPRTITTEKVKNKPINNLRHIISTI